MLLVFLHKHCLFELCVKKAIVVSTYQYLVEICRRRMRETDKAGNETIMYPFTTTTSLVYHTIVKRPRFKSSLRLLLRKLPVTLGVVGGFLRVLRIPPPTNK